MLVETPNVSFDPPLPSRQLGELKDLVQEVAIASSALEGRTAKETSAVLMEAQNDRHARRIIIQLIQEGLICSTAHRAPLTIGFPAKVLRCYSPDIFDPSVLGEIEAERA